MSIADPRIATGMRQQFEWRRRLIADGARSIGWKLGFGAQVAMERLSLEAPLVGFLTDATVRPSGSTVTISDWIRPVVEPELAIYMDADLTDGSDADATRQAIGAVGPAIELADIVFEPENVEEILAVNIFHRAVILGQPDYTRAEARLFGLTAEVTVDGVPTASTSELVRLTGQIVPIIGSLADLLLRSGEVLRAGDLVITGSVVPALAAVAPTEISYRLAPLEPIRVSLR
ncbi:MAG: fumarylacetoacetate hydrolase family protein [Acidimicrobiia bacterium]